MTKSKKESTDAANIGGLSRLIDLCLSYGLKYDPSNPLIKIAAMQLLDKAVRDAMTDLLDLRSPAKNAIINREDAFAPLSRLMTRVGNEVRACGASPEFIKDIINLIKKITGVRVIPKIKQDENTPPEEIIKYISASQMGYDSRLLNLEALISLLAGEPLYMPSENDLKVVSLTALLSDLQTKHGKVSETHAKILVAQNKKNVLIYGKSEGSVETSGTCKKYIRAVFGGNSMEFHDAAKIKFSKRKLKE